MSNEAAKSNSPAVIDTAMSVVPVSTLEAITRGEIDVQIATAQRFPRSMEKFLKRAVGMATMDEETAETCLYCRPVGMKDGKQQFAEGMSVRMAEIVAASYGNIRVAAMIIEQTPRYVKARGFAHDLESNYSAATEVIELTVKKPKFGQTEGEPYDERMRIVIAKAALAKARRDAIFQVVPKALARPVEVEVRKLIAGDGTSINTRRTNVMTWISRLGIEPARVWAAMGINGEADLGVSELEKLAGLKSAINDKDITVEDTFPTIVPSGGVGAKKETKSVTELAAEEKAATAGGTTTAGNPEPAKDKGPSIASLRKTLIEKGNTIGAGKVRILQAAAEMGLAPAGSKWDDLDAATLAGIDSHWDAIHKNIQPPQD